MDSVLDRLDVWAQTRPEAVALTFRDATGVIRARRTYRALVDEVDGIAARLLAQPGLAHGARVMLLHAPGLGTVISLLACARAGLIAVPAPLPGHDGDAAMRRVRAIAANCAPAAVLSDGTALQRLPALLAAHPETGALALIEAAVDGDKSHAKPRSAARQSILFLQYTSGSTGCPRGVIVSHRNVIANALATVEGDETPIGCHWLPQHHDMGLIGYALFPIVAGGESHSMSPSDFLRRPAAWLRMLSDVRASHTAAPDFGYAYCLRPGKIDDEDLHGIDLRSLRMAMCAGETVQAETLRRFRARFACLGLRDDACVAAYGLAEATLNVAQAGHRVLRLSPAGLRANRVVLSAPDEAGKEVVSCGRPLRGVHVRIDAPDPDGIGEICVRGDSVTQGDWGARPRTGVLRTGDLGFLRDGELYVCGRSKECMIVGGANFHPDDLERAVHACMGVRPRGACAFQSEQGEVIVLVEPSRPAALVDLAAVSRAVRIETGLQPDVIQCVAPRSIALTTSGKLARAETRSAWAEGRLCILASHRPGKDVVSSAPRTDQPLRVALRTLIECHAGDIACREALPLAALGVDSLTLVTLQLELEELLRSRGSGAVAEALDAQLLQQASLDALFTALAPLDQGSEAGAATALAGLRSLKATLDSEVGARMQADRRLADPVQSPVPTHAGDAILLTGATGFFGPFLLHELLCQTTNDILVLVRAPDPDQAKERIAEALRRSRVPVPHDWRLRVQPVCGDLALPRLGLDDPDWQALATATGEIFHNGACVNYVMTYDAMRATNVEGTRTLLALAREGGARRRFQLVSSTFVFGWSARGALLESDCNAAMQALDFGYAQTKWVAEQMAFSARAQGLEVDIWRPALISVSTQGAGDQDDVALRMLAFMIRHGVAVDSQNQLSIVAADVIAHNMVGISRGASRGPSAYHVTADNYYTMTELTRVIERDFGVRFRYLDIPHLIDELNRRCAPSDPIYPLLEFFNRSAEKIEAMQLKRYGSNAYREAKASLKAPRADPSLAQTASYLMRYLCERGWIDVGDASAVA
jgi:thioester reductase-like protein